MITSYFKKLNESFIKDINKSLKTKTTSVKKNNSGPDLKTIQSYIANIIPQYYKVDPVTPVDSSNYSSDAADLIIYKEFCPEILSIFENKIPTDLVYGTLFFEEVLNETQLSTLLKRVAVVKKLDYFTDSANNTNSFIPSFSVCTDCDGPLGNLKDEIIQYYIDNSIEHQYELDIVIVLNKGIIIKDWKEKRSFKALETEGDTMVWFFILLNEYIDYEKGSELDFRKYIQTDDVYKES